MNESRRCTASVGDRRCKKAAIVGGFVCQKHGGGAPQVKAAAAQRVADMLAEAIDPDRSMRETARLAYSDVRQLFSPEGKLLPIHQWPDDMARAVSGIEVVRGNIDKGDGQFDDVVKIKLWDKSKSLENLMKHHGKLIEKVEHGLSSEVMDRLLAGRKRVASARASK
jgi:phage terminase small subunit